MLRVEVRPITSTDLDDLQQIRPPFQPYLNRPGRRRPDTHAGLQLHRYEDAERHYRQRRGQLLYLPDSITNRLQQRLAEANALMAKSRPVGTFTSSSSEATCIRTLLSDGTLVHYVLDSRSAQLQRCVLDRSISAFAGRITIASCLGGRFGLFLALEAPSKVLALPASKAEPEMSFEAMRWASGHGWVDNFGRHPICIDLDAGGDLLCVGYRHRIGVMTLQGGSKPEPGRRPSFFKRQAATENTIPFRRYSEILLGHLSTLVACCWLQSAARAILLVAHENANSPTQQMVVSTFQLHASSEMYRLLNRVHVGIGCVISCCAMDHCNGRLAVLLEDSTAMLIDLLSMSCIYQLKLANRSRPSAIAWHPGDAMMAVAFADGEVQALDSAFQVVPFSSGRLQLAAAHGQLSCATRLVWHQNLLVAMADRGPLFAVRFVTGVRVQNEVSDEILVQERLRLWQFDEAVAMMSLSRNVAFRLETFSAMAQVLLGMDDTQAVQQLVPSERLSLLFGEIWPLCKGTGYADKIRCLYHRFVHKLISARQIESAFYHAQKVNDEVLFMDIYMSANSLHHEIVSRLAFKRCPSLHFESCSPEVCASESVVVDVSRFNEMMKLSDWQCRQLEEKGQARLLGVALIMARRHQDAEQLYQKFHLESELESIQSFRTAVRESQLRD